MHRFTSYLVLLGALALVGCATASHEAGPMEIVLKLQRAWVDGKRVDYVTTDISDAGMAAQNGVNYVPRLADTLPGEGRKSVVERVYKFPKGEQISVFQSGPSPVGGANTDKSYSPLWRLVMVTWLKPERVRELKSEEELLSAEDRGEVSLRITSIVANCPIVRAADGGALGGSR
jgi:hypothetical protein